MSDRLKQWQGGVISKPRHPPEPAQQIPKLRLLELRRTMGDCCVSGRCERGFDRETCDFEIDATV